VHGYELLSRTDPGAGANLDAETAACTLLDNAAIFGLDGLTNGLPAFVNCTLEALTAQTVLVLTPRTTVLAIPAGVELTARQMDACRTLKGRGFRLALDDFTGETKQLPLVELADYMRVDFKRLDAEKRRQLLRMRHGSMALVAKNVGTQKEFREAREEGFTLFQGECVQPSTLLKKRKVPSNWLVHFEIVRQLYRDPIDVLQVSQLVLRDPSLAYRLLRLVNSPVYAVHHEVRSIQAAITALGEDTLRRIVTVSVESELISDRPPAILHSALLRARFCELAASECGLDPNEQYLLGMLSLLPAMLQLPMEELTPSLPLRNAICEALEGTPNQERSLLAWLESHEQGDWAARDRMVAAGGLNRDLLMRAYTDAVVWADDSFRS
jgi:EAL and modified HD-GYP domain-containing signal transduction protein